MENKLSLHCNDNCNVGFLKSEIVLGLIAAEQKSET